MYFGWKTIMCYLFSGRVTFFYDPLSCRIWGDAFTSFRVYKRAFYGRQVCFFCCDVDRSPPCDSFLFIVLLKLLKLGFFTFGATKGDESLYFYRYSFFLSTSGTHFLTSEMLWATLILYRNTYRDVKRRFLNIFLLRIAL